MKKLSALLLAILIVFAFCGCQNDIEEEATDDAPETTEVNVINLQMREPDTMDPHLTRRKSVRDALLTVYEPLFNINENFGIENVLAESYAFNENATVMTLKIKEGVRWHDGSFFSSEDVVYTVSRIKGNEASSYFLNLGDVLRAEKHGDYEVVFYLEKPNAFLPYCLYFPIVKSGEDPILKLNGTGPYKMEEVDAKNLVLIRNDLWHMGQAACDGVRFIYMRNSAMAQEAFSSGKIHGITKDMIDTENFAIKESTDKYVYPDGLFEFIGFNAQKGIFADPLLRIAVSNAVDRNKIGDVLGGGIASGFPIMPGSEEFSPSYENAEYNLDYAKEVIFSAGWRDIDNDLKPEKEIDGKITEMEFELLVATKDRLRNAAAEEMKDEIEMAGFTVNVNAVDEEEYEERIKTGNYDAFVGAVYYDAPYDMGNILSSGGAINYSFYTSGDIDLALAEFASGVDRDKASVAFSKLQSLYGAYQPIAGLVFRSNYVLTSPYIKGDVRPFPYSPYANIATWEVDTDTKGD